MKVLGRRKRILLGHLNSYGDCLYATAVARQIKTDYPGSHLTWAIGSMCRSVLDQNPHVDEVWEVPLTSIGEVADVWPRFEREAQERKRKGDFDEIFLTQLAPGNTHLYDGTIRSSIFRAYPRRLSVPVTPVLRLSDAEVDNVRRFVSSHNILNQPQVVLFECSVRSGQSFITPEYALNSARRIVDRFPAARVILSSNLPISSDDSRIIDGSAISFRENAELTKYCSLLIGGSSGVSWIATSDWAKPLPMIQLLNPDSFWFASVAYDLEYWGLATDQIIEMTDSSVERLLQCVEDIFTKGFDAARSTFHEKLIPTSNAYKVLVMKFLNQGEYKKATRLLISHVERNGRLGEFLYSYFYGLISTSAPAIIDVGRSITGLVRQNRSGR